jgi:hypothetical protein
MGGHKITGTVGKMSFPGIGNQSVAYSVTFTIEGVTVYDDFVLTRKGNDLMQLQMLALNPNVNLLVKYGELGIRKVG